MTYNIRLMYSLDINKYFTTRQTCCLSHLKTRFWVHEWLPNGKTELCLWVLMYTRDENMLWIWWLSLEKYLLELNDDNRLVTWVHERLYSEYELRPSGSDTNLRWNHIVNFMIIMVFTLKCLFVKLLLYDTLEVIRKNSIFCIIRMYICDYNFFLSQWKIININVEIYKCVDMYKFEASWRCAGELEMCRWWWPHSSQV